MEAIKQARKDAHQTSLKRLHRWLTLEGSTALAFVILLAGVPFAPVAWVLGVAALLFTPFLLTTLFRTGHTGWMFLFLVMVGVPCLLWLVPVVNPVLMLVVGVLPLLMFYLFCWLLRHAVEEWMEG